MGIESNIVEVDRTAKEPVLVINEDAFRKAMESSNDSEAFNDPEALKAQVVDLLKKINDQSDDYLDISMFDKGDFKAERIDVENAMQEIADKINSQFVKFSENEQMTTQKLIDGLGSIGGTKAITDIFDLYREPTVGEKGSSWLRKTARGNDGLLGHIGSKRL